MMKAIDSLDATAIGLSRRQAAGLGLSLIALGILMLPDLVTDPITNIAPAYWLTASLGIPLELSLALTYAVIPAALLILGAWAMPGRTSTNLKRQFARITRSSPSLLRNHWVLLSFLAVLWLSFGMLTI